MLYSLADATFDRRAARIIDGFIVKARALGESCRASRAVRFARLGNCGSAHVCPTGAAVSIDITFLHQVKDL
jgi:hypothetical protein